MWDVIGGIAFFSLIATIVSAIVCAVRRNAAWKKLLYGAGLSTIVVMVCAVNSPVPSKDPRAPQPAATSSVSHTKASPPAAATSHSVPATPTPQAAREVPPPHQRAVSQPQSQAYNQPSHAGKYVGSTNSDKYHYPHCKAAQKISRESQVWFATKEEAQARSYSPCGICKP